MGKYTQECSLPPLLLRHCWWCKGTYRLHYKGRVDARHAIFRVSIYIQTRDCLLQRWCSHILYSADCKEKLLRNQSAIDAIKEDPKSIRDIYNYSFAYAKDKNQKCMDVDVSFLFLFFFLATRRVGSQTSCYRLHASCGAWFSAQNIRWWMISCRFCSRCNLLKSSTRISGTIFTILSPPSRLTLTTMMKCLRVSFLPMR